MTINLQLWDFSKGLYNEFETGVVNEPSMFEPLKFYCSFTISVRSVISKVGILVYELNVIINSFFSNLCT